MAHGNNSYELFPIPPPLNGKLPCFFKCPQGAKLPHGRIKLPAMAFGCTNCGVCEARPFICGFVGILPFDMNPIRKDAAFYSLQPRSIGVEYGHWCRIEGATLRPGSWAGPTCGIYAPGKEWVPQAGERKKGGDARYSCRLGSGRRIMGRRNVWAYLPILNYMLFIYKCQQ